MWLRISLRITVYMILMLSVVLGVITSRTTIDRKGRKSKDQTQDNSSGKRSVVLGNCRQEKQPGGKKASSFQWVRVQAVARAPVTRLPCPSWGTLASLLCS